MQAYAKEYLSDVVENQGKLFDLVAGNYPDMDTEDFIRTYMASRTRKAIDEAKAYVNTMSAKELWEYFTETEKYILKPGKSLDGFMPDWLGEFYAYYQWYYNIPSSEVIQKIPLDFLKKAYFGLHDLELDLAVKKVGTQEPPVICFHNPDEENGYFSNWYQSPFVLSGTQFSSVEQYMMYRKAVCFGDQEIARQILLEENVSRIKELGRCIVGYHENIWNGIRQIVVYEGLYAKFSQNQELKEKLKATGHAILAECARKDSIWGIGRTMQDPKRLDLDEWKGQNLLGYTLMMVREKL